MCETCGCHKPGAIAQLSAEHDAVINLSGAARRALHAGELDAAADRVRAIVAVLGPHSAVEEQALLPAMAAELGTFLPTLLDQHRKIEAVLTESAHGTPTDPGWPARLEQTLDDLREHILREQDGLFPAARISLDPAQWDQLDAVRSRVGTARATGTRLHGG
jgi:hypothetical protein